MQFIAAIPEPVKLFLARVVLVVGSIVDLIGAVIAAKAAIALVLIGLKILGITLGGIVASLLPAIVIFTLLALVIAGFAIAARRDVGGLGTSFVTLSERILMMTASSRSPNGRATSTNNVASCVVKANAKDWSAT